MSARSKGNETQLNLHKAKQLMYDVNNLSVSYMEASIVYFQVLGLLNRPPFQCAV